MSDLPVMIKLAARRCVVLGGGKVASRRTASLLAAGAHVTAISPHFHDSFTDLQNQSAPHLPAAAATLSLVQRSYQSGDLADALLVVIATDDANANQAAATEAAQACVLVNRADQPEAGNLSFPAHAHHGPITLAVHTSGISAAAAAAIRRELSEALAPHWQLLLEEASIWRDKIQQAITDPDVRRARLMGLTNTTAIELLIEQGPPALQQYYATLADPAAPNPETEPKSGPVADTEAASESDLTEPTKHNEPLSKECS